MTHMQLDLVPWQKQFSGHSNSGNETTTRRILYNHFKCNPNKLHVLNISNRYVREDPELIQELQLKAASILDRDGLRRVAE